MVTAPYGSSTCSIAAAIESSFFSRNSEVLYTTSPWPGLGLGVGVGVRVRVGLALWVGVGVELGVGLVTREVAEEEVLLARAPLLARELRRAEDGRRGLARLRVRVRVRLRARVRVRA